jgi:hypothetical protein
MRQEKPSSYQEYLDLMKLISNSYGMQLSLAEDLAKDLLPTCSPPLQGNCPILPEWGSLKAQDDMNDKVKKYEDLLKSALVPEADRTQMVSAYKKVLEDIAKTEGENADKKTADEFTSLTKTVWTH